MAEFSTERVGMGGAGRTGFNQALVVGMKPSEGFLGKHPVSCVCGIYAKLLCSLLTNKAGTICHFKCPLKTGSLMAVTQEITSSLPNPVPSSIAEEYIIPHGSEGWC